ncbi:hypothetical protein Pmar_PMAR018786 [Perkinsus marinus ATCC 50983]|uniref:Uncharacterized protein n=1 Tax=Perkinsus marinus (strain ATCC 50983 / TXsc) TaxID=423536 RepID=C5KJD2_PERM5|nr:hypothetical protein Pmar_PMAR018786 [Perkinsus marinus ATCC 50983]EER15434.1 hypothetical protein Pmar_PMAR018786 [Perkinsus marinus ATCC 50983]|eukprot:XP_002783638.1 hypothetical protein Pmar_PMAR018786 [Perkinsus marinus ATCC 50983]
MTSTKRTLSGLAVLALVVVLYVASSAVIQLIFTSGGYDKPVALTVYSLTLSILLLACRKYIYTPARQGSPEATPIVNSDHATLEATEQGWPKRWQVAEFAMLSVVKGVYVPLRAIWFVSQLTYNISLK